MGRLAQINPNNYGSSTNIQADFENIVRYLVAAERGNKTVAELLASIFDATGQFDANFQFTYDADGLKYRTASAADWTILATPEDLRGDPGRDIGDVALPIITARVDAVATAGQTVFPYVHTASDYIFVFQNGLLLSEDDYTLDPDADTVTLDTGATVSDIISIYKARGSGSISTTRQDFTVTGATQSVFGLTLPDNEYQAQVFLNGILQAPTTDYIISDGTSSLTLMSAAVTNDVLSVIIIASTSATEIPGFMLEGVYTDNTTGKIPFTKVAIDDGDIPQAKVSGLAAHITEAAVIEVGAVAPTTPTSGDLWIDTSVTPNQLKFYDGSQWLSTRPESTLPSISTGEANYAVYINSTGTGFVYKPVDFSALVYKSSLGVAGGTATLDGDGRLAAAQVPLVRTTDVVHLTLDGAVADGTYDIRRMFGEKIRIIGLTATLASGSCSIQLSVSGATVGSVYAVSSTATDQLFGTVIEVDAEVLSKLLSVVVTSQSAADTLLLSVVIERLN